MLVAGRGSTKGETVGAPLAAYCLRGNEIFQMSHQTANLPLSQAIAFLNKEPLYASISRSGTISASIFQYVFRSDNHSKTNYWQFLSTQELCKLPSEKQIQEQIGTFCRAEP